MRIGLASVDVLVGKLPGKTWGRRYLPDLKLEAIQ